MINLVKDSDWNTKLATLATKAELKIKVVKLQIHDLNHFLGKSFFVSEYVCWSANS